MADLPVPASRRWRLPDLSERWTRLIAAPGFQSWAAGFPLMRWLVRREGAALFDVLAGFCHSQILMALVQFDLPAILLDRPQGAASLAARCGVPEERMAILLRAGQALKLLRRKRSGVYALTRRGAALAGAPGLTQMIRHHDVLYRDLADPAAFFRGEVETELADFWPYVFGGALPADVAATYSDLMAQSQLLVAQDTLRAVSLRGVQRLMDVGGGSGAFLEAVGQRVRDTALILHDLPEVAPAAAARFAGNGMGDRLTVHAGSFKTDSLPAGADAISLIRVLYDHGDDTVRDLLTKCHAALTPGGRLIVSEPMSGGSRPDRTTDTYFALYTLAMRTGKTRSADEITGLLKGVGFSEVTVHAARRPFVTQVIEAVRPRS